MLGAQTLESSNLTSVSLMMTAGDEGDATAATDDVAASGEVLCRVKDFLKY